MSRESVYVNVEAFGLRRAAGRTFGDAVITQKDDAPPVAPGTDSGDSSEMEERK